MMNKKNKFFNKKNKLYIVLLMIILILTYFYYNSNIILESFDVINNKTVVIIHTQKSKSYASKIKKHIKSKCILSTVNDLEKNLSTVNEQSKLIIHPRIATPLDSKWIKLLKEKEKGGAIIVNPPNLLQLTSNKLKCAILLYNSGINHPETWEGKKNDKKTLDLINRLLKKRDKLIIKPFNSISQGAYVQIIRKDSNEETIKNLISKIPTNPFVIQDYINYKAIYRVIIINGKALPFSFIDKPTNDRWKVSVCLNKDRMKFVYYPKKELLQLGIDTQNIINKEVNNPQSGIHFIDIFETIDDKFVISEINTACKLIIHERLAKTAGHPDWQISKHIANYLNSL
jgi:glutathione synthase/RimK-type ligase-like ATP-grasp enzyme